MSIIVNSMWGFVFALMKCSYAAFGEQNKTDNDSKCQYVYKSHKKSLGKFGNMRKILYLCSILEPRTRSQEPRLIRICNLL